jgi:hypothetical protein
VSDRILGSAARKAVIICLANHANHDSELTFPSVKRIAGEMELAESTVREALSWLRQQKLILQVAGPAQHRPATYRLNYAAFSALQQVEVCRPGLQQVAPDLQQVEGSISSPPPGGVRPPAGGPEQYLTKKRDGEQERTDVAASPAASRDQTLFVQALAILQGRIPREVYATWIQCAEVVGVSRNGTGIRMVLRGQNSFGTEKLREYQGELQRAVSEAASGEIADVAIEGERA